MSVHLNRYAKIICESDEVTIRSDVTLGGQLIIEQSGKLTVSYAPFEHVKRTARVVIVGITPGAQQAANALGEVRRRLLAGDDHASALAAAKAYASFSGGMRPNLVGMLDHIGIARWLGVASTDSLWTTHSTLAHFTSALRYPVFFGGTNYNGQVDMTQSPLLVRLLDECLAEEALALPDAVWVPAGPKAEIGIQYLIARGLLKSEQVLSGFLHPSTASNERVHYFPGKKAKERLSIKTNPVTIDTTRANLISKVAALR